MSNTTKPYEIFPVEIIGNAYIQVKSYTEDLSKSNANVLFVGETGSGKELFAKDYMNSCTDLKGERRTVICTGTSDELLHSMVFGHKKGAFTNAVSHRDGLVETCENGIIFLDELGDASDHFQSMILRVAEGNSYSKLGCDKEYQPINVVFLAATSKPEKVREDLKHRFHSVHIPPLQKFDIPKLATHFFQNKLENKKVFPTKDVLEKLMAQDYPGNVRQLRRECEDLLVKNKDKDNVISKKFPNIIVAGDFDYERYERELKTWNKYLQPIVDKYHIDIRYEYLPRLEEYYNLTEEGMRIIGNIFEEYRCKLSSEKYHGELGKAINKVQLYKKRLSDEEKQYAERLHAIKSFSGTVFGMMEVLKRDEKELPYFERNLYLDNPSIFRANGGLPNFLEEIDHEYSPATQKPAIYIKPSFSYLLDLPLEKAKKEFQKNYLMYKLDKCSGDYKEAAKSSGKSESAFRTALSRVKINKE